MRGVRRISFLLLCSTLACNCPAQDVRNASDANRSTLAQLLSFEGQAAAGAPVGWTAGPAGTTFADDKIVHGGHWSARLERHPDSPGTFSVLTNAIAVDFAGKTVELRGFLRTEDVAEFAGLWMREDSDGGGALAFDNMQRRALKGTTPWTEYSITLSIHPEAHRLFFGVLLGGSGTAWADDLQLLVDGKPVWELPVVERPKTAIELDHQFDAGSGIALSDLTTTQIGNLVTLGKVWGFLKYHHPLVVSGQKHWDYELMRILPAILKASKRASANAALVQWIAGLGTVAPCNPCATLKEDDLQLRPDVKWIDDESRLGRELSGALRSLYGRRPAAAKQFYVTLFPGVANPNFEHEASYPALKLPDPAFQLLALYRFWNVIQYWFPYRDVLAENWDAVLEESIPKVALARDSAAYQRELMAVIARAHDGHANLWSSIALRPPAGECRIPVRVRFVGDRPVVSSLANTDAAKDSGLAPGDIITEVDGVPVARLIEDVKRYYGSSNETSRRRDIAAAIPRGACGDSTFRILRGSQDLAFHPKRVTGTPQEAGPNTHDLPGPAFRLLSSDVAYLKLSSFKIADAAHYVEGAAGAKGLIIDIRNYPSEFAVFALGSLLVDRKTEFTRFTNGDLSTPGAFHWTDPLSLTPQQPHYGGKLVILVDEVSQSQAEYTTMALRSAPGALVVGSTTAGADGNVSPIPFPGGFRGMISGIGVFYPDKKPTQRVGILPDVAVQPTIAGIRDGRDEVLEEAIRRILGSAAAADVIAKLPKL